VLITTLDTVEDAEEPETTSDWIPVEALLFAKRASNVEAPASTVASRPIAIYEDGRDGEA
jgi:hypothetical protein